MPSLLIEAVHDGALETVKLLVLGGASVNERNPLGQTALTSAVVNEHLEILEFLLDHDADIDKPNKAGLTALALACAKEHLPIIRCLLKRNASLNTSNPKALSPLVLAVSLGRLEAVKLLLEAGAQLDERGIENQTPLLVAVGTNQTEVFKFLLSQGASLEDKNAAGETPLDLALKYERTEIVAVIQEYLAHQRSFIGITWFYESGHYIFEYGKGLFVSVIKHLSGYNITRIIAYANPYSYRRDAEIFEEQSFVSDHSHTNSVRKRRQSFVQAEEQQKPQLLSHAPVLAVKSSTETLEVLLDQQQKKIETMERQLHQLEQESKQRIKLEQSFKKQETKMIDCESMLLKQAQKNTSLQIDLESQKTKTSVLEEKLSKQSKIVKELQKQIGIFREQDSHVDGTLEALQLEQSKFDRRLLCIYELENSLKEKSQKIGILESALSEQRHQIRALTLHIEKLEKQMTQKQAEAFNFLEKQLEVQRERLAETTTLEIELRKQVQETLVVFDGHLGHLVRRFERLEEETEAMNDERYRFLMQKINYLEHFLNSRVYPVPYGYFPAQAVQPYLMQPQYLAPDMPSMALLSVSPPATELISTEEETIHAVLKIKLSIKIDTVLNEFVQAGYHIFIVGGAVRDLLVGKPISDIDCITDMPSNILLNQFKKNFIKEITYVSGLYQMRLFDIKIDILYRGSETFTSSTGLLKDAQKRVFTVNALYCDAQGKVYDPLEKGVHDLLTTPALRVIDENPLCFEQDPCLLLRAARLIAQYQLVVSESLKETLQRFSPFIRNIDFRKLHIEEKRHFLNGYAVKNFDCLMNLGLFKVLYPKTILFLESKQGERYGKWLYQALHQTDQLILNNELVSMAYIYASFVAGSVLAALEECSEKTPSRIEEIIDKTLMEAFQDHFDTYYLGKIKKMTLKFVHECLFLSNDGRLLTEEARQTKQSFVLTQFHQMSDSATLLKRELSQRENSIGSTSSQKKPMN
ncbi:MAG: ankyrin repeat domain-containing protein [Gammaproteobacteria bacterium]|nr:ankyrin repeat domain-containing protein [Gammaproteobacteria bacterium]